jgi:hypothetical protein
VDLEPSRNSGRLLVSSFVDSTWFAEARVPTGMGSDPGISSDDETGGIMLL